MVAEPGAGVEAALRAGDEATYAGLVRSWSPALLRTALALSGDRATAEAVVRATWLRLPGEMADHQPPPGLWGFVCGLLLSELDLREAASSRGDGPSAPAPTVDPSRFLPPTHRQWPGHWHIPPTTWPAMEDGRPSSQGVGSALRGALDTLPRGQRVVVGLRDVAGCEVADIARVVAQRPEHVRDLLHRGRAEVRRRLELHFADARPA
jgi:RNA polymerase sigma-70 factor (ECF subfamily)